MSRAARFPIGGWLVAAILGVLAMPVAAQGLAVERQAAVEAAFMRNFARYVNWPARAFADARDPWKICVVDDNHFDASLEQSFRGRTEQGRAFEVRRSVPTAALPLCHIVFIGEVGRAQRQAALAQVKDRPVLTVGNTPDFLSEGGVVRLLPGVHMEMSINLDQARFASLGIPAKLLEVSSEVVENSSTRRLR